jgi:hypothetical protein
MAPSPDFHVNDLRVIDAWGRHGRAFRGLALAVRGPAEDITDSGPGRADLRVLAAQNQTSPNIDPM